MTTQDEQQEREGLAGKLPLPNWRAIVCSDIRGYMVCHKKPWSPLSSLVCRCKDKPKVNMGLRTLLMNQVFYDRMHLRVLSSLGWEEWTDKFYAANPDLDAPNFARLKQDTLRTRVRSILSEVSVKHDHPHVVYDDQSRTYGIQPAKGIETHMDISEYDNIVLSMSKELVEVVQKELAEKLDRERLKQDKKDGLAFAETNMGLFLFEGAAKNGSPDVDKLKAMASEQASSEDSRPQSKKRAANERAKQVSEMKELFDAIKGDPEDKRRRIAVEESNARSREKEAEAKLLEAKTAVAQNQLLMKLLLRTIPSGFQSVQHVMQGVRSSSSLNTEDIDIPFLDDN